MRIVLSLLIIAVLTLFVNACNSQKEELLGDKKTSCDTLNVTYQAKVVPIIQASCLSCHGNSNAASNGGGIRLQDYADIKSQVNRVYGAVSHLPGYAPMPLGMSGTIDPCQIAIIRKWKEAGAPNN